MATLSVNQGNKADVGEVIFDLSHVRSEPLDFYLEIVYPNSARLATNTEPEVSFDNGATYQPVINGYFHTARNTRYIRLRFKINNDNEIVEDNYVWVRLKPGPANHYITNSAPLEVSVEILDGAKGFQITQDSPTGSVFETQTIETDYSIAPPLYEDVEFKVEVIPGTGDLTDVEALEYTLNGFDFYPVPVSGLLTFGSGINGFTVRLTPVHKVGDYDSRNVVLRTTVTSTGKILNKTITITNTDNHPAGEFIEDFCSGFDLWGRYHDGAGGTYDQIIAEDSPDCGFVHPPLGEVLREFCAGYDLMQHIADGNGSYTVETVEYQSITCGWEQPTPNPQTQVTPTNWNPSSKGLSVELTEGNRVFSGLQRHGAYSVYATMANKWYWEIEIFFPTAFHKAPAIGLVAAGHPLANWIGSNANSWAWWPLESRAYWNDLESPYGAPIVSGDMVSVLYDSDARTLEFWLNGVSQGIAFTNLPQFVKLYAATNANEESYSRANFGQWVFKYTPPAGFLPGFGAIADEPIERGTDLGLICDGVDQYRVYADGRYGTYRSLTQANSPTCGYVPPPPAAGTTLGYVCQGTSYYRRVANGSGGETLELVQHFSSNCGYVPPPTPPVAFATLNPAWFAGATTFSNGNKTANLDSSVDSSTYIQSSRWYWEVVVDNNPQVVLGVLPGAFNPTDVIGLRSGSIGWSLATKEMFVSNVKTSYPALPTVQAGDVIGIYVDYGVGTIQFSHNNVLVEPVIPLPNVNYWFGATNYLNTAPVQITVRFTDTEITGTPDARFIKGFGTPTPQIPAKGTYYGQYCVGYTRWYTYHDGVGGTYNAVYEVNSPSCGYVPPEPAGKLKSYVCKGEMNTDRWAIYHDGNYGTYESLVQLRSPACGYLPFGTLISSSCDGTTKMGTYSDGEFGTYEEIIEANSVECGYNSGGPPTAPPPGSVDPTLPVTPAGALTFSTTATHTNGALIFHQP